MELLVDREIVGAEELFAQFGQVRLFSGRDLLPRDLGAAEILLVRSVTKVDPALLLGSAVRFVGSATAGIDHIDSAYLEAAGVAFAYAAGCNARAVAEHTMCCVYAYAAAQSRDVRELKVAIVGYGHVGRELGALLTRLNIEFIANDPPLGALAGGLQSVALSEVLKCDVISLHVPLTRGGEYPTAKLFGADEIDELRAGTLLINAARGGVVDEDALRRRMDAGTAIYTALDCWVDEPGVNQASVAGSWLATPHIAGHTLEARVSGSLLLHAALCRHLHVVDQAPRLLPPNPVALDATAGAGVQALLMAAHPLAEHTARMRSLAALAPDLRRAGFDELRRRHGLRREFASFGIARHGLDTDTSEQLQALGFNVR